MRDPRRAWALAAAVALAVATSACAPKRAPAVATSSSGRAVELPAHEEPEVITVVHTVKRGQTLYRIARAYELSVDELMAANRMSDPRTLEVGQTLLIPGATEVREVPVEQPVVTHKLEAGQTLYRVAKQYDRTVEELMRANGISDPRALSVGQVLVIPDRPEPPATAERESPAAGAGAGKEPPSGDGKSPPQVSARSGDTAQSRPPPETDRSRAGSGSSSGSGSNDGRTTVATARSTSARDRDDDAPITKGTLDWPLRGVLYARFGKKGSERHDGIDLSAPVGTPVKTAAEGQVLYAGEQRGYGNIVIVEHAGGLVTLYAHNRDVRVKSGQRVRRGQVIATVGESGRTSGPQLHFEVRKDTLPVDPLRFLGAVPRE